MRIIVDFSKSKNQVLCPNEKVQKWLDHHWLFVNNQDEGHGNRIRPGDTKILYIYKDEIWLTLKIDVQLDGKSGG